MILPRRPIAYQVASRTGRGSNNRLQIRGVTFGVGSAALRECPALIATRAHDTERAVITRPRFSRWTAKTPEASATAVASVASQLSSLSRVTLHSRRPFRVLDGDSDRHLATVPPPEQRVELNLLLVL